MERGGVMGSVSFRILQSEGSGEDMGVPKSESAP